MAGGKFPGEAFAFLDELKTNNDRAWFAENKTRYQALFQELAGFAGGLLEDLSRHDVIETPSGAKSLYRIYRDVRFSKDKTPYSTYWGGRFRRAGKYRRGGYYFHFEPGGRSFVLAGFWGPNAADLKLVRDEIAFDPSALRAILADERFVRHFGALEGERLKTSPKGYDRAHEAIDLLRYRQFLVTRRFSDSEVAGENFRMLVDEAFRNMRPFLDYMSDVLSLDGNGETLRSQ